MKATPFDRELVEAALAVRSANPEVYKQLVMAHRNKALRSMHSLVECSPDHILHLQGRAREALWTSDLIENAADHLTKLKAIKP